MPTATSLPARRMRFTLGECLAATARGVAFAGLMAAGFGLLVVLVAAVFFIALGAAILIAGNGGPRDQRILLGLLAVGAGLGLGRFALPAALLGIRRLARLTRQLAGDWCGVPVVERYAPPPAGRLTFTGRLMWLATDPATWRDLWWTVANPFACVLAAGSVTIAYLGG